MSLLFPFKDKRKAWKVSISLWVIILLLALFALANLSHF